MPKPHLTRKGLPGEPEDEQSRHIEAIVDGTVFAGLYLPNGNAYPSAKFDYKLRCFRRLHKYAAELLALEVPLVLIGDFNVMPTDLDVYKPERWKDDALFRVEVREAYKDLADQGWIDAPRHLHPGERIYTFWNYFRNAYARDAGLRIGLLPPQPGSVATAAQGRGRPARARLGAHERSCAGLDRTGRCGPILRRNSLSQPSVVFSETFQRLRGSYVRVV